MTVEQFLGLYNYWIVIFLMMTGFYIVIARENFIKTIIGLNIFQISVILLYITMGKVSGGTAPIISPEVAAIYAQEAHVHDDDSHGHDAHEEHPRNINVHDEHENAGQTPGTPIDEQAGRAGETDSPRNTVVRTSSTDDENKLANGSTHFHDLNYAAEKRKGTKLRAGDIIYSNPLPSVLMLTAIVVGVATTALALALIVRIREDYGTIEEDEVLALDRKS